MKLQTCSRHPEAGSFALHCPGCKQDRYDREVSNRVRAAFDMPPAAPVRETGETPRRVAVWTIRELNDLFVKLGGTVTARPNTEYPDLVEVTVSVDLPSVGSAQAFTDWDPAREAYATDLPMIAALPEPARA